MKAYAYDSNGFHVATFEPQLDPLESAKAKSKVYLIPPYATTVTPPVVVEGKVARWLGSAWVIEDYVEPAPPSIPDPGFKVPESEPETPESREMLAQAMQGHQDKLDKAVESIRAARAKGIKSADAPKVLEDLFTILGV